MVVTKTTSAEPYRQFLNFEDRIHFIKSDKYVALSNLSIYYTWKNIKSHT